MRGVAAFSLLALTGTGCFYLDPINQRPSIDIIPESSDPVHRGDKVVLDAKANDPEGQYVAFTWHVQACVDATNVGTCAPAFFSWVGEKATFDVPAFIDTGKMTPTASVRVVLEGIDDGGAAAKPAQTLIIPVENALPDLALRVGTRRIVDNPIDIFASVGDRDDGPSKVQLAWTVYSPPTQPTYTLTDQDVPQIEPTHLEYGKTFVPAGTGEWTIEVKATDRPDDAAAPATVEHVTFMVVPDHVPCLTLATPAVAPSGQTLPVYDPTLFQVLVVSDDLDPYPGTTSFHWSLKAPGASVRQAIGTTSSIAFDPAAYTPGDVVELRVEIEDRKHVAVNCPDGDATCSVISDASCVQRQTWLVEVK